MNVTSLIENTSRKGLPSEHGLSLHIQMDDEQSILFDMGQGRLFAENAERLGVNIKDIDTAVISHGHYDHGGGLETFLFINDKAKVYIHKRAFEPHYSLRDTGLTYIGLKHELHSSNRIVFCEDKHYISDDLMLFSDVTDCCWRPVGNRLLFGPDKKEHDDFCHEQNMIIKEGNNVVLFAGCAHNGIVGIIHKTIQLLGIAPTHVLAGMHLVKSGMSDTEEDACIAKLTAELMKYAHTQFYTMHCTGEVCFNKLKNIMGDQIEYLSCGDDIEI